jgi:hypothetical protein
VQHKTIWNVARVGSNRLRELLKPGGIYRLRELLKLYACPDRIAPVDEDAVGTRVSELIRRARGEPPIETAEIDDLSDNPKK